MWLLVFQKLPLLRNEVTNGHGIASIEITLNKRITNYFNIIGVGGLISSSGKLWVWCKRARMFSSYSSCWTVEVIVWTQAQTRVNSLAKAFSTSWLQSAHTVSMLEQIEGREVSHYECCLGTHWWVMSLGRCNYRICAPLARALCTIPGADTSQRKCRGSRACSDRVQSQRLHRALGPQILSTQLSYSVSIKGKLLFENWIQCSPPVDKLSSPKSFCKVEK